MVHDVEPGSAGDDHEFGYWDVLTTIDGKQYEDPNDLFIALQEAQATRGSVTIEILRISVSGVAFFDYLQRELPIEGLVKGLN